MRITTFSLKTECRPLDGEWLRRARAWETKETGAGARYFGVFYGDDLIAIIRTQEDFEGISLTLTGIGVGPSGSIQSQLDGTLAI